MIKIDAKGKACPIPLIETKKALKNIEKDGTVLVTVDNEIAKENLEKMADELGYKYSSNVIDNENYEVTMIKGLGSKELENINDTKENNKNKNTVVISSDKMGTGNDELGRILLKGFIYTLMEIENVPSTIIFYNGGVQLATVESDVLEDLQKLERMGVEILTCGTCLDYYKLKEKLAVGKITNMYTIVEKMTSSTSIIKP